MVITHAAEPKPAITEPSDTATIGHYIWGSTILPLEVEQLDSHRAELYGLLGINTTMQLYFKNVSNQTITYACDNHSALMYTFDTTRYERARSTYPDYDLIQSIRTTIPANLIIQHTHVKGHQDGKHRTLTFLEILNVFVDKCATNTCKEAIRLYKKQPGLHIASPHVHWHLQLNGFKIVKNISTSVYEYISERTMREYCSDKNIVTLDSFDDIHWKAHGQASKQVSVGRQQWLSKHTFGHCGNNHTLQKWDTKTSSKCARCDKEETSTHVWKCQHVDMGSVTWCRSAIDL